LKAIRAKAPKAKVEYDDGNDPAAAAKLAAASDVAIVFVNQHTTEGGDVATLSLPGNQDSLVSRIAAANRHTIVVLETGGPVIMPWVNEVSAVLEAWYPGIRGGEAIAGILFGEVNPSAKLPVTFPKSEADLPHTTIEPPAAGAPGAANPPPFELNYSEGMKVGYKWFDAGNKEPLFPFGFGLSYTTYSYAGLRVRQAKDVTVTFAVTNTGKLAGTEIAQVYASLPARAAEPPKRLVAWKPLALAPGETRTVTLTLDPYALSIFNVDKNDWELAPGEYKLHVGGSSRSTPLTETVHLAM
jgi:beta-glucosidase